MSSGKDYLPDRIAIRTCPEAKRCLDRIVADLKSVKSLRFCGKKVTQDVVSNAIWMWIEELGFGEFQAPLARQIAKIESGNFEDASPAPEVFFGEPAPIRKLKGKKA